MDIDDFRSLAMTSAALYYRYLEANGRGYAETRVYKIEQTADGFLLKLASRLSAEVSPDSLEFKVCGKLYTAHQINPVSYDAQAATLLLRPQNQRLFNLIASASPADLLLCSDLKFLVKRVYNWYDSFGSRIHLSRPAPSLPPPAEYFGDQPTLEQQAAIRGALTEPFSYIWGAPGTGKTRCVLANCIIALLRAGKKVLLTAPTNNAVEQMLFGLIPVLEQAGYSADCALRLGLPSRAFAKQYSAACESAGLAQRTASAERQLKIYQDYLALRAEAAVLSSAKEKVSALADRTMQFREDYVKARMQQRAHRQELTSLHAQKTLAVKEMNDLLRDIAASERSMHSLRSRLGKLFSTEAYQKRVRQLEALYRSLKESKELSSAVSSKIKETDDQISQLEDSCSAFISEGRSLAREAYFTVRFSPKLQKLFSSTKALSDPQDRSDFFSAIDDMLRSNEQKQEPYEAYRALSDEELSARMDALTQELKELQCAERDRYSGKSIIACTVDRYISAFPPGADSTFVPNHIFMDEAGYCCLIKAATLLARNVPVTLLGDHMQLPPVCEMNDSAFSGSASSVFLWSQSSIYLEDLFEKNFDQMLCDYKEGAEPAFRNMPKYDLTLTHRFGDAIASVLARSVYPADFSSANPGGTSILILDAPRAPSGKRQSISEVHAIDQFLAAECPQDYAILTPYHGQRNLLSRSFPKAAKDGRILTVHASQGREWDTLIFSPVDNSSGSLWFANSLLQESRGKAVINTAISRAKRQLVIACDRAFWESRPEQLIAQLIDAASAFPR